MLQEVAKRLDVTPQNIAAGRFDSLDASAAGWPEVTPQNIALGQFDDVSKAVRPAVVTIENIAAGRLDP